MPVDTTGPFPADPNTGQRAVTDDGAPYYYDDEYHPPGVSYARIQRSPGNVAQAVTEEVAQPVENVVVPDQTVKQSVSVSSSPTVEEGVVRERKKSSVVSTGGSGGGISVPWMDIAQGFSAAGQAAAPVLQTQAAMLAMRAAQQRGVQFVPTPVPQVNRDWTMLIVGGTVLVGAGILLLYALKRK